PLLLLAFAHLHVPHRLARLLTAPEEESGAQQDARAKNATEKSHIDHSFKAKGSTTSPQCSVSPDAKNEATPNSLPPCGGEWGWGERCLTPTLTLPHRGGGKDVPVPRQGELR